MERWLVLIFILSSFTLGCQRDTVKGARSTITIQVPQSLNSHNKSGGVGAMSAMPVNRKACYGVNVIGPGIKYQAPVCGPQTGILGGFIEPGGLLAVSVPKGSSRKVELFAFLQEVGQNIPCPTFTAGMTGANLAATYKVGTALNVDMVGDNTSVTITADFPGLGNNIAQQLAQPVNCTAVTAPGNNAPGFSTSSGRGIATGGTITLYGGFGIPQPGQTASSGNISLTVK